MRKGDHFAALSSWRMFVLDHFGAINLSNRCLMVLRMTQASIPLIERRMLSSVTALSHYVLSNSKQSRVWNSFMNSVITAHPRVFGSSTHN